MTEFFADIAVPDVALLANGAPPRGKALDMMLSARALVACDGAAATARTLGRECDFAVGDGDSLAAAEREAMGSGFVRVEEQDTNDLAKAFRFVCSRFAMAKSLVILGAHGLRDDHFLGNVSLLPEFAAEFVRTSARPSGAFVCMVTDSGRFDVVLGSRTFRAEVGDPVSVFAFNNDAHIVSDGLEWPLAGVELNALWKGSLNRANKETVVLTVDAPIVVFRPVPAARAV